MTEQLVSYDPDDQLASTIIDAGRYCVVGGKFVDDFDFGGAFKKQTAALLTFQDPEGRTYEQHFGVGDKARIYPSSDGQGLVGGALSENSNWGRVIKAAIQNAGLPKTRLWASPGVPAAVQDIFAGIWGEWIKFVPDNAPKTRKNAKGQEAENTGHLIPNKFYMDGDTVSAQATAPSPTPPPTASPPPPPLQTTPPVVFTPPPAAEVPPVPPSSGVVNITSRFPEMLEIAKAMVADTSYSSERNQLATDIWNKLDVSGMSEIDAHALRGAALNTVMGTEFTEYMRGNGMKVEAEVVSVA